MLLLAPGLSGCSGDRRGCLRPAGGCPVRVLQRPGETSAARSRGRRVSARGSGSAKSRRRARGRSPPARAGVFTSRARSRPSARLSMRRLDAHGTARLDLQSPGSASATSAPSARCFRPESASPAGRSSSRRACCCRVTKRITLRQRWRCVRDREGEFGGIQPIKPSRWPRVPAWRCGWGRRGYWRRGAKRPSWSQSPTGAGLAQPRRILTLEPADHRRRRRSAPHYRPQGATRPALAHVALEPARAPRHSPTSVRASGRRRRQRPAHQRPPLRPHHQRPARHRLSQSPRRWDGAAEYRCRQQRPPPLRH